MSQFSPSKNGPLTLEIKLHNQLFTATLDHGAKASIIASELVRGHKIYRNTFFVLTDFGHNHIFDGGFVLLPLELGKAKVNYPFFVVDHPPCPILIGYDFISKYQISTDEIRRCVYSQTFGDIPYSSPPYELFRNFHDHDFPSFLQAMKSVTPVHVPVLYVCQSTSTHSEHQILPPVTSNLLNSHLVGLM